jgi:hypothetical protein
VSQLAEQIQDPTRRVFWNNSFSIPAASNVAYELYLGPGTVMLQGGTGATVSWSGGHIDSHRAGTGFGLKGAGSFGDGLTLLFLDVNGNLRTQDIKSSDVALLGNTNLFPSYLLNLGIQLALVHTDEVGRFQLIGPAPTRR